MRNLLFVIIVFSIVSIPASAQKVHTVKTTNLWYGSLLRNHFPENIPIHGWDYPIDQLPCHSIDITRFNASPQKTLSAFQVSGSLVLGSITSPYSVMDGAQGRKYMLHLQAYLFSPAGKLVWQQRGFPQDNAWISAEGGKVEFILINSYSGSTSGYELIILAAGDPIFSTSSEIRVILGVKRITLP